MCVYVCMYVCVTTPPKPLNRFALTQMIYCRFIKACTNNLHRLACRTFGVRKFKRQLDNQDNWGSLGRWLLMQWTWSVKCWPLLNVVWCSGVVGETSRRVTGFRQHEEVCTADFWLNLNASLQHFVTCVSWVEFAAVDGHPLPLLLSVLVQPHLAQCKYERHIATVSCCCWCCC